MHPVIGSLVVGLTDPQLILGIGLLVLTLAVSRVRATLRQPQQPRQPRQRKPPARRAGSSLIRGGEDRAAN